MLDRYEALVVALDTIYLCKQEPAVRGLCDNLIKPITTATLCVFTDILLMTNSMQKFLQSSWLNFVEIPKEKEKLTEKLQAKYDSPCSPDNSYFGKLESFLKVATQSASERYDSHSNKEFNKKSFEDKMIKPFISQLIKEIEVAFDILEHLKRFTAMDPSRMPEKEEDLATYAKDEIASLANFYRYPSLCKLQTIDREKLINQHEGFKKFVFKKKLEWETKHELDLEMTKACLNAEEKRKATLLLMYSKRKITTLDKSIKSFEN